MLRLNLRAKLLAAFGLVLLPVLGLLLLSFNDELHRQEQASVGDQLLTAQAVAAQVEESFDSARALAWSVAEGIAQGDSGGAELSAGLEKLLADVPASIGAVAVFDEAGRSRASSALGSVQVPQSVGEAPWFRRVVATNAATVSEVGEASGAPQQVAITVAVPLRGPDARPRGAVAVVMVTERLAKKYDEARLRPGQAIALFDRAGRLAFDTRRRELAWDESNAYSALRPVRAALAGVPTAVSDLEVPGEPQRLGAFVPTPAHRWAVAVTVPRAVALAAVHADLRKDLLAFAAILLLSAAFASLIARKLADPVRRLEVETRALGRGELGRRVAIRTGDELERLGAGFNEMAGRLEARDRENSALRAEAEQRAAQLEAVFASMTDAVFIATPDGTARANPRGLALVGVSSDEELTALWRRFAEKLEPRAADGTRMGPGEMPMSRALAGETFSGVDLSLRLPGGVERLINASGSPVRDDSGCIVLAVVVARDVTEERRRLREKEAIARMTQALGRELELDRVVDVLLDQGVAVLGVDYIGLWRVDEARRELRLLAHRNLSPEASRGLELLSFDDPMPTAAAARTGSLQVVEDLQGEEVDEKARRIAVQADVRSLVSVPLRSRGRTVGVTTISTRARRRFAAHDLDFVATVADLFAVAFDNASLYESLRESLRLREEFLAAAAHELKTPVTTIRTWSQLLLREGVGGERDRRALSSISRQTYRIAALVEGLVVAARLRSRALDVRRTRFDLAELGRELLGGATLAPDRDRVRFGAAGAVPIEADRDLLATVFVQLVETALRQSSRSDPVDVAIARDGGEAILSVHDHGAEVPPERQPHFFAPLYEPLPAGAAGYVGQVSLGPYLAKLVAEAHGGRVSMTSAPGEGRTLRLELPIARG